MNVDFRRDGATHYASFLVAIHVLCSIMGVWESMVWFGAVLDTASRAFTEEGQIPWEERIGLAERWRRRRDGGGDGKKGNANGIWKEGKTRGARRRVVCCVWREKMKQFQHHSAFIVAYL